MAFLRRCRYTKWLFTSFILLCIALGAIFARHNVSTAITQSDRRAIVATLNNAGYKLADLRQQENFEANIRNIRAVQDAVFNTTPEQGKIPRGQPREPADLVKRNEAQCGDRSRFMHKAFRMLGYDVRFASLFSTNNVPTAFHALLTPGGGKVKSHAVVEVRTQKGWMIVDSVRRWIARDQGGDVYSLAQWQDHALKDAKKWSHLNNGTIYPLLADDFTYMYGLYSRHGYYYPPYNRVPDIHWPAFITNIYRF